MGGTPNSNLPSLSCDCKTPTPPSPGHKGCQRSLIPLLTPHGHYPLDILHMLLVPGMWYLQQAANMGRGEMPSTLTSRWGPLSYPWQSQLSDTAEKQIRQPGSQPEDISVMLGNWPCPWPWLGFRGKSQGKCGYWIFRILRD